MESENQVLKQVEALFSAIDSLPDLLRREALKNIQSRLGPAENTKQKNGKQVKKNLKPLKEDTDDEDDDSRGGEEELIKLCESDGIKILHCYSEAPRGESSGVAKRRAPNTTKSPLASPTKQRVRKKKDVIHIDVGEVDLSGDTKKKKGSVTSTASRSKRKRRVPKRFLDGEENPQLSLEESSQSKAEDESDEKKEENSLINVYKVPTGVKPNEILHDFTGTEKATKDGKRIKGQKTIYGCTICNRKFHSRSMVVIHMRVHTGEKPHRCHICEKSFTQRGALNIHVKRHEGKFGYACEFCSYKTVAKVDLMRHVARHSGERNYSCEYCGKGYITDSALRDHLKHVHARTTTHSCQMCAFTTHRPDNLKRHMVVKHSNKEYLQCPICHEFIKQRGTFITHLRTHTGERPHACPTCDKHFNSRSQVAAHLRIHKQGMFQCKDCQRRFKTRFHLKRHSVVHTGEKPFACMYCEYSCNVKGNINKHVRLVHGVRDFSFKTINGPKMKEAGNLGLEGAEAQEVKEKGKAIAEEFLTKLSIRKDENLTVEELKKAMELKKSERKQTDFPKRRNKMMEVNGAQKGGRQKKHVKFKKTGGVAAYEEEEAAAMTFLKDFRIEVNDEIEIEDEEEEEEEEEDRELRIEEQDEEASEGTLTVVMDDEDEDSKADGTTIILPTNGFICVQQPGIDGEEIALPVLTEDIGAEEVGAYLPPTTVYLIQCKEDS